MTNYNEELAQELAILRDKTKRGMLPLVIRNPTLESATLRYVTDLESFHETIDKAPIPIPLRDEALLHRAADIVMYEELTWSHPDKMSIVEYPIMSDRNEESYHDRHSLVENVSTEHKRENGRRTSTVETSDGTMASHKSYITLRNDGNIERLETQIIVHEALDNAGLTQRQRQAIELVYFENMTQEDAARELGVHRRVLMRHHDAGLRKLYEYMTKVNV